MDDCFWTGGRWRSRRLSVGNWRLKVRSIDRWRLFFLSWREFRVNVYSSLYYCYSSIPYYDAVLADDGGRMSCETKMSS